jgi:periplasmic divalent cation tolerance protein
VTGVVLVESNLPDRDAAERIGVALLDARLAAAVNIHGPALSLYRWRGAVRRAEEWTLVAKTAEGQAEAAVAAIRAAHPYETPSILVRAVAGGFAPYLDWVRAAGD